MAWTKNLVYFLHIRKRRKKTYGIFNDILFPFVNKIIKVKIKYYETEG